MPCTRLCEKDIARHRDPAKRFKIARAMLREMTTGRLFAGQKMLIETLVPLYLEILEQREHYGEKGFDMRAYMELQSQFQRGLRALVEIEPRRYRRKGEAPRGSVASALSPGRAPKGSQRGFLEGLLDA